MEEGDKTLVEVEFKINMPYPADTVRGKGLVLKRIIPISTLQKMEEQNSRLPEGKSLKYTNLLDVTEKGDIIPILIQEIEVNNLNSHQINVKIPMDHQENLRNLLSQGRVRFNDGSDPEYKYEII